MPANQDNHSPVYLLPREVSDALAQASLDADHQNLSLLANLYLKCWDYDGGEWQITTAGKESALRTMKAVNRSEFLGAVRERAQLAVDSLRCPTRFSLKTSWRMIVGLGSPSPLETSMTLHPVYGFPFIPGTAVKGIARAWAEKHAGLQGDVGKKLLLDIFGSEDKYSNDSKKQQVGGIIFFDAYPKVLPDLDIDVMTPHYSEYYTNGEVPGDWFDPVPVKFLAVAANAEFTFSLAASDRTNEMEAKALVDQAQDFLKQGLVNLGVGAKTNAGYGYFTDGSDNPPGHGSTSAKDPEVFHGPLNQEAQVPAQVIRNDNGKITVRLHTESPVEADFTYKAGIQVGKWVLVKVTNPKPLSVQFLKYIQHL